MRRILLLGLAALLAAHSVAHVLGAGVYARLWSLAALPYKTTLWSGAVDVGEAGMAVLAIGLLLAGLGFLVVAYACWQDETWWPGILVASTVLSLVVTGLDWDMAYAGIGVDLVILGGAIIRKVA
jgi:hypothetical protein